MIPLDDPRLPKYWLNETSGRWKVSVMRLLNRETLDSEDIQNIRDYFRQWIDSSAWVYNPHANDGSVRNLLWLRDAAVRIVSGQDIDEWLQAAIEIGIDPL